jgi:hypothetical protein
LQSQRLRRPGFDGACDHNVEIARIDKDARDEDLPNRLTEALMRSCQNRPDAKEPRAAAQHVGEVVGNLGRDPEVRALPSGQYVANFALATKARFKDRNSEQQGLRATNSSIIS